MTTAAQQVSIAVDEAQVSGLLIAPPGARACYVLAHGAGAGMAHPFMAAVAQGLAASGIATLRYQFPYMERGSRRPDSPRLAQATVRDRVPKAGIVLTITDRDLRREPGLERGRPWDASRHVEPGALPKASCIWVDHVKLNESPGLLFKVARKAMTPGMMDKSLSRDYENNLY